MRSPRLPFALPVLLALLASGCAGYDDCAYWNGKQDDPAMRTCAFATEAERPDAGGVEVTVPGAAAFTLPSPRNPGQAAYPDGTRLSGQPWGLWTTAPDGTELASDSVGAVTSVAVSPDGRRTALGVPGRVLLRDGAATTPFPVAPDSFRMGSTAFPNTAAHLAFSPDGARLAVDERTGRLVVWDVATRQALWSADEADVSSLAFSPDGARLAAGSIGGKSVRVWDAATGALLHTWTHPRFVTAVAFAPDGRHVAAWLSESARAPTYMGHGPARVGVRHAPSPAVVVAWALP